MKKVIEITVILLTLFIAVNAFSEVPPTPTFFVVPVEVTRTPTLQESPVVDAEGNIFVSEFGGQVTKITPEGEASVWLDLKYANGHVILSDGTHLLCSRGAILRLDSNAKEIGEPVTTAGDKTLQAPNDIVLDPYGGFYFTDSAVKLVGYVDSKGESHLVQWYPGEIGYPNGIAISPDGKVLYMADTYRNAIYSFKVLSPGKVGPEKLFAKLFEREDGKHTGCDGITTDDKGNLYVPHYGTGHILVFNPQGELISWMPGGEESMSNIWVNGDQIYVTCGVPDKTDPDNFEKVSGVLYKLEKIKVKRAD